MTNKDWKPGDPAQLTPPNLPTCVIMVGVGERCGKDPVVLMSIHSPIATMPAAPACPEHFAEFKKNFPANEISWTEL